MSYRRTPWGLLVRVRPDSARGKILTAYLGSSGNAVHAARLLDVSHRSLLRYVATLGLADEIEKIRAAVR